MSGDMIELSAAAESLTQGLLIAEIAEDLLDVQ
jgi:hypothetical protein